MCLAPANAQLINKYTTRLRYHEIRFPTLQVWPSAKPELCYGIAQLTSHVYQPPILMAEILVQYSGEVLQVTVNEQNNIGVDLFLQVSSCGVVGTLRNFDIDKLRLVQK